MEDDSGLFDAFKGAPEAQSAPRAPREPGSPRALSDLPIEGSEGSRASNNDDDLKSTFAEGSKAVQPTVGSTAISPFVGFNRGLVSAAGAPVDLVNWALSKTPLSGLSSETPFGGSESIKRGLDIATEKAGEYFGTQANLNPYAEIYNPRSNLEKYIQAGGRGAGEAVALAGAAPAVVGSFVARNMPRTAEAIQTMFAMRAPVGTSRTAAMAPAAELTIPAFTGGVGAEAAQELVPENWKGLAGVGGGIAGGTIGALGVAGAKALPTLARGPQEFIAPLTESGRQREAARRLGEGMESPAAAVDVIENAPRELVAGSKPTTFELTGQGGQLQRRAETLRPEPFIERRGEQAAARMDELSKITPEAEASALPAFLRQRLEQFDETAEQAIAGAGTQARAEIERLGGFGTPEEYGESLRKSLADAKETMRKQRSALYDAIDPEGKINVIAKPIRDTASTISEGVGPYAAPLSGETKRLFDLAKNLPDVLSFKDLRDYDTAISNAMSAERRSAGETATWNQLRQLKSAVKDAIANGVENQNNWEQSAVAAGKMSADDTIAARLNKYAEETGASPVARQNAQGAPDQPAIFQTNLEDSPVYYPHGQVRVRYEVVDANDLVTSHDRDFRVRPEYPADLQPRDRSSVPAQDQVNKIASDLQPERLGPSPEVNTGAPIIGPDNIVESGNGRTLAIQKAYDAGRGDAYRTWLESQGFNTQGMERPVLVGRRITDMSPEDRVVFAQSANDRTGLEMGAVERAAADARLMGDITTPIAPGPLSSAENSDFVREFSARLTPSERGSILDKNGTLSQKGEKRIQAALSASAYEDPAFLSRIFESTDNNIKGIGDALTSVAGPWAKMRQAAARGDISPEHDITPKLMDAVRMVMRARDEGKPLGFYLEQGDMFVSPVEQLAKDIIIPDGKKVASAKSIRQALAAYADEAQKNLEGERLFGEPLKPEDILRASTKKAAEEAGEQEAAATAKAGLTPNITAEDAAALARANAKHAEYAQTFRQGPVGNVLRTEGYSGQYRTPNATVVGKFFPAGPGGYEAATAFRRAVGDDQRAIATMQDYISWSLKREAMREDGTLDPKKFATWRKRHDSALRAFPEVEGQFDDAVRSSQLVDELAVAKRQAVKDYQQGLVKRLMGLEEDRDVAATVGSIFGKADSTQRMRELAALTAKNPDAQAALKRSVADFIAQKFVTTTEAGTSEANLIRSAQFQQFVRDNKPALRAVFNEKEVASMQAIADDLHRSNRSVSGSALPGRPTTAQDVLPDLRKKQETNLGLFSKAAIGAEAGSLLGGVKGMISGAAAAIANTVLGNMRKAGMQKVEDLVVEALLNPDVAAQMLKRIPERPDAGASRALAQSIRRLPATGFLGAVEDLEPEQYPRPLTIRPNRESRATGGRTVINVDQAADALIRAADQAKKALGGETEALLNHDDNTIAKALEVANQAI